MPHTAPPDLALTPPVAIEPLAWLVILGEVVQHGGVFHEQRITSLEAFLSFNGVLPPTDLLWQAIDAAVKLYRESPRRLFVCTGAFCRRHHRRIDERARAALEQRLGVPVTLTDCLNLCGAAPSAVLRLGDAVRAVNVEPLR